VRLYLGSAGTAGLVDFVDGRRLAYVPTAGKPLADRSFADESRASLRAVGFEVADLDIDGATTDEMGAALETADAVFVEGGSPFFLLQAIRESGFDRIVADAVRGGLPYMGMSAGAVVAGPDIEPLSTTSNTSYGPRLTSTAALGLVDFVVYPHYDIPERAAPFPDLLARYGGRFRLLPLVDGQAVVVDEGGTRIVTPG
jgi:dipeptidase E